MAPTQAAAVSTFDCTSCSGIGLEPPALERTCKACGGVGVATLPSEVGSVRGNLSREYAALTEGDRNATHGDPVAQHRTAAALWTSYLERRLPQTGGKVTARDVCIMQGLLKVSRMANGKPVRDHFGDAGNYFGGLAWECEAAEGGQ